MDDNYKNELIEKYLNGNLKYLSGDDSFTFSCNICGKCCRNRNDILLNPFDVYRISKYLNMLPADVISKYCNTYIGDTSRIPILSIKFKEVPSVDNYTVCPFLRVKEGLAKCTIHDAKPFVCAAYPLGRIFTYENNKLQVAYFKQDTRCGGDTIKHTVNDWLKDFNIEESEQISIMFTEFITDLWKIIDIEKFLENKEIPDTTKNMFFNVLLSKLYLDIDLNSDLKDTIKANLEQLNSFIKGLVDVCMNLNIDVRGSLPPNQS